MIEAMRKTVLVTDSDKYFTEHIGEIVKSMPEAKQIFMHGLTEGLRMNLSMMKEEPPKGVGVA